MVAGHKVQIPGGFQESRTMHAQGYRSLVNHDDDRIIGVETGFQRIAPDCTVARATVWYIMYTSRTHPTNVPFLCRFPVRTKCTVIPSSLYSFVVRTQGYKP